MREKLYQLIRDCDCGCSGCDGCKYENDEAACISYMAYQMTDHLIANGVTIDPASLRPTGADRFAIVFGEIAAYNDYEEWLWELADKLSELEAGKYFCCPITTEEWLTDKHALWMMLVSAYGNWGTSIRHGWIEKTAEAAEFINEATGRYAEWRSCT